MINIQQKMTVYFKIVSKHERYWCTLREKRFLVGRRSKECWQLLLWSRVLHVTYSSTLKIIMWNASSRALWSHGVILSTLTSLHFFFPSKNVKPKNPFLSNTVFFEGVYDCLSKSNRNRQGITINISWPQMISRG